VARYAARGPRRVRNQWVSRVKRAPAGFRSPTQSHIFLGPNQHAVGPAVERHKKSGKAPRPTSLASDQLEPDPGPVGREMSERRRAHPTVEAAPAGPAWRGRAGRPETGPVFFGDQGSRIGHLRGVEQGCPLSGSRNECPDRTSSAAKSSGRPVVPGRGARKSCRGGKCLRPARLRRRRTIDALVVCAHDGAERCALSGGG